MYLTHAEERRRNGELQGGRPSGFFDLLPEAINLGAKFHSPAAILGCTAVGFLFYLVLDRILWFHGEYFEAKTNTTKNVSYFIRFLERKSLDIFKHLK